ncbi:MAG: hypothetical protein FGM39_04485 [Phycisphaerales bacterium]|nr:hypothetical protein [Phycisphaerales bacterium]
MRRIVALAAGLTLMVASAASAGIPGTPWYSNAPKPAVPDPSGSGFMLQDGPFSDAFSSGGNYFYSFALGQRFSVSQTQTFGSVRLWGASEYIESGIPPWQQTRLSQNISAIQVSIFDFNGTGPASSPRHSWTINVGSITQTATGNYVGGSIGYSPVFRLDAALLGGYTLGAGSYLVSVGAVLTIPDGSAFAWMSGIADGTLAATRSYGTSGDQVGEWGQWAPLVAGTTGAIEFYSEIPAPGAVSLLALGGLARRRRRR